MGNRRTPAEQDSFMGTDAIIEQVELARGSALRRLLDRLRGPMFALGGSALALLVLVCAVHVWRQGEREVQARAAQLAAAAADAQLAAHAPPHSPASSGARPGAAPAAPVAASSEPAAAVGASATEAIRITVAARAAEIWVDGQRVAEHQRSWQGRLPRGEHHVTVRAGGRALRHALVLGRGPTVMAFDPAAGTVQVHHHRPGHHAAHAP